MHIPDGFVNAPVAITTGALASAAFVYATCRTRQTLPASRTPLLGVSAAFIFAAQMLNFPVAAGTSGHFLGAAFAAILLGPSAAIIAMSAVVILQCFMFADGGISALGANILNMAVLAPLAAFTVYRALVSTFGQKACTFAAFVAGLISTLVASAACSGQIALSGKASPLAIFTGMLGIHTLIGVAEGLITAMTIAGIAQTRPELLRPTAAPQRTLIPALTFGLLLSLALAIFVSPFASPWPDGLEHIAEQLGFNSAAIEPLLPGLMPDYAWERMTSTGLSTALAGALGTITVLAATLLGVRAIQATRSKPKPAAEPAESR